MSNKETKNNKLDEFNVVEIPFENNEHTTVTWKVDIVEEVICSVCDKLFVPDLNRPPIFCPVCKEKLKVLVS